ncbi:hypothetical protein P153DRAFT_163219 [Dothidotthia symphoricarpi CBS 119687]|uniref:Uncharacterized protein n=1 Tax=Dothidotthia symphoricarpi CBS 119687 TaxID=1392245 RepID=A0A6A5ZYK0_9PLEO|nr:uncharacterized protein P153DRAFT_163219 [Dothidotthia symphoricarpi CBS 119687]KAF2123458.1 hypothetical protein P153DRAFT_163219 [Dothidotthia symphoricarpi CBS 119687]
MENTTQHPYRDSPPSSPNPSTTKPLLQQPQQESYRDHPTASYSHLPSQHPPTPPYYDSPPQPSTPTTPHANTHHDPPPHYTDDDVPLALLFYPYEAPPSYAVAVRTPCYRDTLIQYIPSRRVDADEEEAGEPDDVRYVERVFAMFIVVVLLLVVGGVLVWLAVGSGVI